MQYVLTQSTILTLQGRARIATNEKDFAPKTLILRKEDTPEWVYANTGQPADPTAGRDITVEDSLAIADQRCGRVEGSDLFVEPGITQDGRLVVRALSMPHAQKSMKFEQLTWRWALLPFKSAADSVEAASEGLGLQLLQREPPAYALIDIESDSEIQEGPSGTRDTAHENNVILHSRLQLFSDLLEETLPDTLSRPLPELIGSGALSLLSVRTVRDDDFLSCLRLPADGCHQEKTISYFADKEDRFGGQRLIWMTGPPRALGHTARLLASVYPTKPNAYFKHHKVNGKKVYPSYSQGFEVLTSLALPTDMTDFKGLSPSLPFPKLLEDNVGAQISATGQASIKQYMAYAKDSERSTKIQESILGPEFRDTAWGDINMSERLRLATGFVAAGITSYMRTIFQSDKYPLTAPLLDELHQEYLTSGRYLTSQVPDPPNEVEELIALMTKKYKVTGAYDPSTKASLTRSSSLADFGRGILSMLPGGTGHGSLAD